MSREKTENFIYSIFNWKKWTWIFRGEKIVLYYFCDDLIFHTLHTAQEYLVIKKLLLSVIPKHSFK